MPRWHGNPAPVGNRRPSHKIDPKLAKGGKRPGAGPLKHDVKIQLTELLNKVVRRNVVKDEAAKNIVDLAYDTIVKALGAKDEHGKPNTVALRAAEYVWDHRFGRARESIQIQGGELIRVEVSWPTRPFIPMARAPILAPIAGVIDRPLVDVVRASGNTNGNGKH